MALSLTNAHVVAFPPQTLTREAPPKPHTHILAVCLLPERHLIKARLIFQEKAPESIYSATQYPILYAIIFSFLKSFINK